MNDLSALIKRRSVLKANLTRCKNFADSIDPNAVDRKLLISIRLRKEKMEPWLDEFEAIQSQIETFEDDTASHEQTREWYENLYFEVLSTLTYICQNSENDNLSSSGNSRPISVCNVDEANLEMDSLNNAEPNTIVSPDAPQKYPTIKMHHVKLPQLKLPTFSGEVDQWLNFYDVFNSVVHSNSDLPDIQKFQYLKTSLTGDAATLIHSLQISSDNYGVAWNLLKERFENKPRIIYNHIKSLFDIEPVLKESHISLQQLINNTLKHVRALNTLGEPTQHWDSILIYLISSKLDYASKRDWEKLKVDLTEKPTLNDFINYVMKKCQMLETISSSNKRLFDKSKNYSSVHASISRDSKCKICSKDFHPIYCCKKFIEMSVPMRIKEITRLHLCKNCFRSNHFTKDCVGITCKICKQRHNTLLHIPITPNIQRHSLPNPLNSNDNIPVSLTEPHNPENIDKVTASNSNCAYVSQINHVLLPTAIVNVKNTKGELIQVKILLDSGSQSNFIRQDLVDLLNLETKDFYLPITGINNFHSTVTKQAFLTLYSRTSQFKCNLSCFVLPNITDKLPQMPLNIKSFNIPENIVLADPTFYQPGTISILVDAEIFWSIVGKNQIKFNKNHPTLHQTLFGWIVSGPINCTVNYNSSSCMFSSNKLKNLDIQKQMAAFWELEEVHSASLKSQEEIDCEKMFNLTTKRNEEGRFVVKLPFNDNIQYLGESYQTAYQRFLSLEKRFDYNPSLFGQYSDFIHE